MVGVYSGAMGALAVLATVVTFALFLGAVYCDWKFFGASEAIDTARWGVGAVLLAGMVGFVKLWFWLRLESNRVLREVKRLELQIARSMPR